MGLFFNEDINTLFVGGSEVSAVYMGSTQVWPVGLPVGTVFNFEYTGTVQSVELPKGKYKLQCWGAQGGSVTGTYAIAGSKGGYSEGVLTLTKATTLYVFVGGQGTSYTSSATQTSTTTINGGWNGGGAGKRTVRYSSGGTDGRSFPRGGGGATDISTVTSAMSYSGGRTTRDSASLLARCIVAGGGAGGSSYYRVITTNSEQWVSIGTYQGKFWWFSGTDGTGDLRVHFEASLVVGSKYRVYVVSHASSELESSYQNISISGYGNVNDGESFIANQENVEIAAAYGLAYPYLPSEQASDTTFRVEKYESTSNTESSHGLSNKSQQGGGTSGKGQYPGKATSAGTGGAFGLGANQTTTNHRYCGGGGGGGWYGGGTGKSDSSTSYVNYSGGGSGFVNISANASSRPSGYTGLQLDSGTTTAGSSSHPSTSGGTETGHSGNGYARITVIE